MKTIDKVDLAIAINPFLKAGIRLEDLTLEQQIKTYKDIFKEDIKVINEDPKYSGYGYHGGGRPKADKTKCKNLNIRIMEDDKIELQEKARLEGLTVTEYILNALKFYYNREIERRIGK